MTAQVIDLNAYLRQRIIAGSPYLNRRVRSLDEYLREKARQEVQRPCDVGEPA